MLVFFPPLRLAVLAAYAVAVSTAPSTSTDPGLTNVPNLGDPGPSADLTPGDPVDVALAYSFIQSGGGDHSIKPANHSTYVDADDTPEDLNATVEGIANIKLSGPLAAPRHIHDKRGGPTFRGCTPVEVNDILAAIYTGWKDARRAASGTDKLKMNDNNSNEWATKYRRWFGPIIEARRGTVEDMLLYIESKVRFRNWPFLCRTGERAAYPAKIFHNPREIVIYQGFWDSSAADRVDTLLRIAGNRSPHTKNVAVGVVEARRLALAASRDALFNYDNYDAFIRNRPDPIPR